MGKATWDPTFLDRHIHVEAGGMLRDFTDQVYWGNHSVWGASVEAGLIVPIIPKWLDFQFSGLSGNGNGRYGAAQISDATFSSTGGVQPIHERQIMVGLTARVTPRTDVYVFAGGEFASSNFSFVNFRERPSSRRAPIPMATAIPLTTTSAVTSKARPRPPAWAKSRTCARSPAASGITSTMARRARSALARNTPTPVGLVLGRGRRVQGDGKHVLHQPSLHCLPIRHRPPDERRQVAARVRAVTFLWRRGLARRRVFAG